MAAACLLDAMAPSVKYLICLILLVCSVNPRLHQVRIVGACLHKEQVSPYFPPSHWITARKDSALQTTVDVVNRSRHYSARTSVMHPRSRGRSRPCRFLGHVQQRNVPIEKAEISFNPKTKS